MKKTFINLILERLQFGHYEQCEEVLIQGKEAYPDCLDFDYYYAKFYMNTEKNEEALKFIDYVISKNFKLEDSLRQKCTILRNLRKYDEALEVCDKGLEMYPNSYMLIYSKGKIKADLRLYDQSIKLFREAIEKKGRQFIEAQDELILSYCKLQNYDRTFELYNQYYKNDPNDKKNKMIAKNLQFKAKLYSEFRQYNKAMQTIEEALQNVKEPTELSELMGDKIVYLYYNCKFERCIEEGEQLIENHRGHENFKRFASLFFYVGCAYQRLNKNTEANKYFDEYIIIIKEENLRADYYVEKARIIIEKEENEAIKLIDKALIINPNEISAIHFKLNFLEKSITYPLKDSELYEELTQKNNKINNEIAILNERLAKLEDLKVNLDTVYYDLNTQAFMIKTVVNTENSIQLQQIEKEEKVVIEETSNNADLLNMEKLGSGGFGAVYKTKIYTGEQIAVKRFDKQVVLNALDEKEKKVLQEIKHKNIVQYKGFFGCDFLMELCEGGDVYTLVIKNKIHIPLKFKYKIIRQIAEALNYLHNTKQIIHGDIKNQNILLDAKYNVGCDTFPNAKLCDFGLSAFKNDPDNMKIGYSLGYAPPEALVQGGKMDFKSDIYSFGMTIYELISGEFPFESKVKKDIEKMVKIGIHPNFSQKLKGFDQKIIDLLDNCCKAKPENRCDINYVLQIFQSLDSLE